MTARSAARPLLLHLLAASALCATLAACSDGAEAPPSAPSPAVAETASEETASAPVEPSPTSNAIRWTTASEVGNYGYDVYRADSPAGPFERLTEQPIPGAGTTDTPSHYEYVDDTIVPGREYYYYVESISAEGERHRFTPVRRAPPKTGPAPAGDAASAAESEPEQ